LPLEAIEGRLAAASMSELERLAAGEGEPARPRHESWYFPAREPVVHWPAKGEQWERVELVPGLEVHLRSDAGAEAKRIAHEIRSRYATRIEE
jgi:hypothetical protein